MKKICNVCKEEKLLSEFSKDRSRKDGLNYKCKNCSNKIGIKYYNNYKEAVLKRTSKYANTHKEQKAKTNKAWEKENRKSRNAQKRSRDRERRKTDPAYVERINAQKRRRDKERRETDPVYKLKRRIGNLINSAIKRKGFKKTSKTYKTLGCTYKEFLVYLNNNPYNLIFSVNTDLDHIIPISSAVSEEDVLELNHYTNYQLLPLEYNRNVKKDQPWDINHFENWLETTTL